MPCKSLIRHTYGYYMIKRELRVLKELQGINGIPKNPFLLDKFALCYKYISGRTLKEARKQPVGPDFFLALESMVKEMHSRNIVHLDIRYMRNILLADDGTPALLDFQTSFSTRRMPHALQQLFRNIDISGVYKCWQKISPGSMDKKRLSFLASMEKKRSWWIFKGYPLGTRLPRR